MKVEKRQVICVLLGIILALACFFVDRQGPELTGGRGIGRNSYGQGEKEQVVIVEGLLTEKMPVDVRIGERQYTAEEAAQVIQSAVEELPAEMSGDNESLERVRTSLKLTSLMDDYGVSVQWQPEDTELISPSGEVFNRDCPENGTETHLTARLKAGEYSEEYVFRLMVFPPGGSEEEKKVTAFKRFLAEEEEKQKYSEVFLLPAQFEGEDISYTVKKGRDYLAFPLLGALTAVLLPFKDRQKEKEEKKNRERQMMMDYSEILSRLVVFLGAGLPVRKAWEKIVADYMQTAGEDGKRAAYEEMTAAYHQMQRGVPEIRAYSEFGSRCKVLSYRKLAGILEQNVKNGSRSLSPILETEMENAFEQRKNLARRLGEEASTKLLLPLFMILMIVMVMISVPAFLAFGI